MEENLHTPYVFFTHKDLVSILHPKALRSHHRADQYVVFSSWVEGGMGEGKEASCQFAKISGVEELPHASEELRQ
jgi:hypothetical protein